MSPARDMRLSCKGLVLALILISVAIPLATVEIPPILDYPNHLSRYWLLGRSSAGILSPFYAQSWGAITNIVSDLAASASRGLIPVTTLGSIFLFLAATLPPIGAILLNSQLFDGDDWWVGVFPIIAWNALFLAGFINFEIGIGLAMLAVSAEQGKTLQQRWIIRILSSCLLLICHLFALGFYALLLAGVDFGNALPRDARKIWGGIARAATGAIPCIAVLCAYVFLSPTVVGHSAHTTLQQTVRGVLSLYPRAKANSALMLMNNYNLAFDLGCAVLLIGAVAAAAHRGLKMHAGLFITAVLLGVIFALSPDVVADTGWIDRRFALLATITLLIAIRPRFGARFGPVFLGALCALFMVRTALVTSVWLLREQDVRATQLATARIPQESLVLPLEHTPKLRDQPFGRLFAYSNPTYWHLATLPIMWRGSFVPTLFVARDKQPIEVREHWSSLASMHPQPASVHVIVDPPAKLPKYAEYAAHWRAYDYALVLNADVPDQNGPVRFPTCFSKFADSGFAVVWDIRRCRRVLRASDATRRAIGRAG